MYNLQTDKRRLIFVNYSLQRLKMVLQMKTENYSLRIVNYN